MGDLAAAIPAMFRAAGKWAWSLLFGLLPALANGVAWLAPDTLPWEPSMKWVYLGWTLGLAITFLAAFAKVNGRLVGLLDSTARPVVSLPRPALNKGPSTIVLVHRSAGRGVWEREGEPREVHSDESVALLLVHVSNDPPTRSPNAIATRVYAMVSFDEVKDGQPVQVWGPDTGVWVGVQPSEPQYVDLEPNGAEKYLVVLRLVRGAAYVAYSGSYRREALSESPEGEVDPLAVDERWRLPGSEYRVRVALRGVNMEDLDAAFRINFEAQTEDEVISWWD